MDKRQFLKTIGFTALSAPVFSKTFEKTINRAENVSPEVLAQDEAFWKQIRADYKLNPAYINLENGYYCISPTPIKNAFLKNIEEINLLGSYYMRTVRFPENEKVRAKLAEQAGCLYEEMIVTRNATESIDTVISGYDWKPGDEAIMAEQDYPYMIQHFELMAKRYGMVNKILSVPANPKNDEEIVNMYEAAITPKTRLLMVCHIINITGQILPIKKICDMAHSYGVDVVVDGAHAFGQFDYKISDLNCDYYATSLHKWLSAPLGLGFLYIRKEKIKDLWATFADNGYSQDDIRRVVHTGTPAVHTEISILNALEYLNKIGIKRKEARLKYIRNYWMEKLKDVPNVVINTSFDPERACGIGNIGLKNMKPTEMADRLLKEHKIWTVGIEGQNVFGCRITPNIYTNIAELDAFVKAVKVLSKA
ncbi:aminotransferase class V-fold PLP-dependent enzyme [Lacihabitans sp. LS3-19]|uniref:aminotransferase class V-fold PLP-dependent enzyme n=1 Tax=Lacihabitans sp. LS3-19 TaxID=2487335 RepID=UPI0020CDB960|nr:aminotransferase class V-fold PLP-dependent enzyme [Lacihabitans sp. LS3-19]MCP9767186.1 aminotransferase class V-fold PLP-dependent enzyme [Lacihabitans sp. LS3-19]